MKVTIYPVQMHQPWCSICGMVGIASDKEGADKSADGHARWHKEIRKDSVSRKRMGET